MSRHEDSQWLELQLRMERAEKHIRELEEENERLKRQLQDALSSLD